MVTQTARPLSPAIRAYIEAGNYIVSPASCEGQDWDVIKRDGGYYTVDLGAATCTCPDFQHRGQERACKHIELVKLHVAADAPALAYSETVVPHAEDPFADAHELDPEYAAQLTAELQRETDVELDRIRRERDLLWG